MSETLPTFSGPYRDLRAIAYAIGWVIATLMMFLVLPFDFAVQVREPMRLSFDGVRLRDPGDRLPAEIRFSVGKLPGRCMAEPVAPGEYRLHCLCLNAYENHEACTAALQERIGERLERPLAELRLAIFWSSADFGGLSWVHAAMKAFALGGVLIGAILVPIGRLRPWSEDLRAALGRPLLLVGGVALAALAAELAVRLMSAEALAAYLGGLTSPSHGGVRIFLVAPPDWVYAAALVLGFALAEELILRGYLFAELGARWRPPMPVAVSALLFVGFHLIDMAGLSIAAVWLGQPLGVAWVLGLGLGLSLLRAWSGSAALSAVARLVHDGIVFAHLTLSAGWLAPRLEAMPAPPSLPDL